MQLFSRSRILRDVLTVPQALTYALISLVTVGALAAAVKAPVPLTLGVAMSFLVCAPLAVAAAVDAACHILPDPLLLLAAVLALAGLPYGTRPAALLALATAAGAYLAGRLLNALTSFGMGDGKLLAVLGLWVGTPRLLIIGTLAGLAGAAIFSICLMAARRATLTSSVALGPWLVAGGVAAWLTTVAQI